MEKRNSRKAQIGILLGDMIVLAGVTVFGFASHGAASTAGSRMLTTFIPLVVGWLLLAPHLGAYDLARAEDARQLWRPLWAMLLAAPLAAWLRGAWLRTPIQPVFVFVLGGVSALSLLAWRGSYLLLRRTGRRKANAR
jgi:hypothetical protein